MFRTRRSCGPFGPRMRNAISQTRSLRRAQECRDVAASDLVDVRRESSDLLKRMAQGEHVQRRCRETIRVAYFVRSRVLLQMVLAAEAFAANDAGMRPHAGVNPLVPRQLLVPGEGLAAGLDVAFERSLACNGMENETFYVFPLERSRFACPICRRSPRNGVLFRKKDLRNYGESREDRALSEGSSALRKKLLGRSVFKLFCTHSHAWLFPFG